MKARLIKKGWSSWGDRWTFCRWPSRLFRRWQVAAIGSSYGEGKNGDERAVCGDAERS